MTSHTGHLLRIPKCHLERGFPDRRGMVCWAERRCCDGRALSRGADETGAIAPGGGVPTIGAIGCPPPIVVDAREEERARAIVRYQYRCYAR